MHASPPTFVYPYWLVSQEDNALRVQRAYDAADFTLRGVLRTPSAAQTRLLPASVAGFFADQARGSSAVSPAEWLEGEGYGLLFLELTATCNERCVHCYAESSPERDESLEWKDIQGVLDDAVRLGFSAVQLTGGDPLLSPHVVEAARYAAAAGLKRVEVYTNGLALKGALLDALIEARVRFAFSIYAGTPEAHDAVTQVQGSFARTLAALGRLEARGVAYRVSLVLNGPSEDGGAEAIGQLVGLGVPESAIQRYNTHSVGRGTFVELSRLSRPKGEAEPERRVPEAAQPNAAAGAAPMAFGGTAAVGPDGTVYPCIFSRSLPLGNLRDRSLHSILREPSVRFRQQPAAFDSVRAQLSCWPCRLRTQYLEPDPSVEGASK